MQQTDFKFEAVVHDDASTDGTAAIIAEFAEKYPDIIKPLYETENQYSKKDGSLRRIMNAHMRGKYIAMCEGDDYWTDPHKLQKQVDFMEANPEYGLCFTNVDRYSQDTGLMTRGCFDDSMTKKIESLDTFYEYAGWYAPCTCLYRQVFIDPLVIWRGDRNFISGDLCLMLLVLSRAKVKFLNVVTTVYRDHQGGVSKFANRNQFYKFDLSLNELLNYANETLPIVNKKIIDKHNTGFVQNHIKNILLNENRIDAIKLILHANRIVLRGVTFSTRCICKYYYMFLLLVKFEHILFKSSD